jgi:hypothetical protein
MTLSDVKTALLTVSQKVYHHTAEGATGNYIVWAEDGQSNAVHGNGIMKAQVIQGTIHYFTTTENDPVFDQIQTALNAASVGFWLNSIQYETETKYIHYEWVFDIPTEVA